MKLPLLFAALLAASCIARADVVIVQQVQNMAMSGTMTIMVGTDKIRTDASPQMSMITDIGTGDTTTLMRQQKAYLTISSAATQAMMAQMKAAMQKNGAAASPPALVATGKMEKVDGYNASIYTFSNGNIKATYWMSTEFPNLKMVQEAMGKLKRGNLADMTKMFSPDISSLPGVPVKTEVEMNGQKNTIDLISAQEQAVDPSEYKVPADYTEMKMPAMPGGAGGQP